MKTPTTQRPSTQLLRDLIEVRIQLADVENSNEPTIASIDPLKEEDDYLSETLIRYLCYELNIPFNMDFRTRERRWENL